MTVSNRMTPMRIMMMIVSKGNPTIVVVTLKSNQNRTLAVNETSFVESDSEDNPEVAATRALIEKLSPMKKKVKSVRAKNVAVKKKIITSGDSDDPITLADSPMKEDRGASTKSTVKSKAVKKPAANKSATSSKTKKVNKTDDKQSKISFAGAAKKGDNDGEKKKVILLTDISYHSIFFIVSLLTC